MNLTKFTFIISISGEGKERLVRLDTLEEVPRQSIHMIKQLPIILKQDSDSQPPMYTILKKGFREKSNALLLGEKIKLGNYDYYPASYCKI